MSSQRNGKKTSDARKELEELLMQASDEARISVRGNVTFLDAEVVDWYEYGNDKNDGTLIQPVEAKVPGEDQVRRYSIRGPDAIVNCFGEPTKVGDKVRYSKVEYNKDGIPIKCKVPDIPPNETGTYWYGLKKA